MSSFDWNKVWDRRYNNVSDDRWKTKSLNPMLPEQYNIKLPKNGKSTSPSPIGAPPPQDQGKGEPLPSPKIYKINEFMFCIILQQDINLFYIQSPEDKTKKRSNKMFGKSEYPLGQKIEFVTGLTNETGDNFILVGTVDKVILLKIVHENNENVIKPTQSMISIPEFRTLVCFGTNRIAVASSTQIYEFELKDQNLKEILVKKIEFNGKEAEQHYKALKPIGMVVGSGQSFYYFGSRLEVKVDESKLKGVPGEQLVQGQCQALTIVQMKVEIGTDITSIKASVFPIDHIFELGLFTRTKIYQIQRQTFLVSLHEEIILIKKNFHRYIVWDNVSVVSSKSQSKKGQLSLAAQTILVYSEKAEIYAHQILYNDVESKLLMPTIDNFRGNDNDEQILYDALILSYEGSIAKVLIYVKPQQVVYPNQSPFRQIQTDPNKAKQIPTTLDFTIMCINQNEPKRKLEQLIQKKKPNQQIQDFCIRYNISQQDLLQCKWNVSGKKQKDIESILMMIKDDSFIQTELDNILKAESHNLEFLSIVQTKQTQRLRSLLAEKIAEYSQATQPKAKDDLKKYIFKIFRWLMESEMFGKKLNYSKNFLTFKEYDFIEIGKLRAASLKEEIKLLSCKKYEKRLKYFLNEFKTLVISNFEEVFNFLLMDKSVAEIQEFIYAFRFILPNFVEPSEVFILKRRYNVIEKKQPVQTSKKRQRLLSFNPVSLAIPEEIGSSSPKKEKSKEKQVKIVESRKDRNIIENNGQGKETDKCHLWEDLKGGEIEETMEFFLKKRIQEVRGLEYPSAQLRQQAVFNLKRLLEEFQAQDWFTNAAFKQHCMITKSSQEIIHEFTQLKRKKAFKILIKFLYHEVQKLEKEGIQRGDGEGGGAKMLQQVNQMIETFIADGLIPQSFKRNVDARVKVYNQLLKPLANRKRDKKTIAIELPELEDLLIKNQPEYFLEIFSHIRNQILTKVKQIYDDIEVGFFRQRFQLFLKSNLVEPQDVISFLDQFTQDVQADDIRIEVFSAIKRLLKVTDQQNTRHYIDKSLDKEILPQRQDAQCKLRDQAKIPYGFYFYHLFVAFNLNYTYQQLIGFTNETDIRQNRIILELVQKYCADDYKTSSTYDGSRLECKIYFEQIGINDKLPDTDIYNQPLQFFGLLLIFLDMLDFYTEQKEVFELMMENYLNRGKFKELSDFIMKLKNYHITEHNMNTKNYQIISDFKDQIDIDGLFMDYTLDWIERNYQKITDVDLLDEKMKLNDRALNMLEAFNKNSQKIRKQRALFVILLYLMKFEASLALNVQEIKDEAVKHGSFMFMMHMFNKIGGDKFIEKQIETTEKIECLFKIFESHQEHVLSTKVDYFHTDFIRFLIQVCIRMIEKNSFQMAQYLILYKIPNDNEYFRDVLLLFLAAAKRDQGNFSNYSTDIVKMILTPETTSLIRNNLQTIIAKYKIRSFVPVKAENSPMEKSALKSQLKDMKAESRLAEERPEEKLDFYKNIENIFRLTMSKYRKSDAFFLLVRAKIVRNDSLKVAAKGYFTSYSDSYQQQRQNIEFTSYFLATSYLKVLEMYIEKQFYPTFGFFESKTLLLQDPRERKDIIKDINIALSKLQKIFNRNDKNRQLFDLKNELQSYYNDYMAAVGEDPDIKLVDSQTKGTTATIKAEIYTRKKEVINEEKQIQNEVNQYKKAIQQNINRAHEVQEDSRLNVLNRQVTQYISEIRKGNERHALLEADIKKQVPQMNLAEKKAKQFEEIKRKEKEDIQSIKETYKSNTTKRVHELIQNLRKKRQQIKAKTYAPTSPVRDEGRTSQQFINPMTSNNARGFNINMPPSSKKVEAQQASPFVIRTNIQKRLQNVKEDVKKGGNRFVELQKKIFPEAPVQPINLKKKFNFDDVVNIYREKESPEALQCIQKYDMLKNPPVRMELIKRAFAMTVNLDSFLQFLRYLIESDATWKESIEEKSIPIATQMIKMQPKQKITIKEIIPAEFFTKISKVSLKDYYPIVFELFKPSLKKIFQKDLMPVHAVGILFRYALGSQNRFYSKVFYEYFSVVLKAYQLKNYDDKELTLLAEKIRSNYSSLPDSKDQVLEELLSKIAHSAKKTRLLQALKRVIERKGESLVGGQTNKQINFIVQKLMKT